MTTIQGYSGYVPHYRIARTAIAEQFGDEGRSGDVAVPGHDETVVSLATEAGVGALEHAGVAPEDVDAVFVATTSDPFDERGIAAQLAFRLGVGTETRVGDFQGSARASTNALLTARDLVEGGTAGTVLVAAADVIRADPGTQVERTGGAGAGAVVLSKRGDAATFTETAARTTGFVGRFKRGDRGYTVSDDQFNRRKGYLDSVVPLLETLGQDAEGVVLPAPKNRWATKATRSADVDAELYTTFQDVGYAAAGGVLLDTALALDELAEGDRLVTVSYGPGGSDGVRLEVGGGPEDTPQTPVSEYVEDAQSVPYMKHRRYRDWNRS